MDTTSQFIRPSWFAAALCALALSSPSTAQDIELDTLISKFSYMIGVQIGSSVVQQLESSAEPLDRSAVAAGISDVFAGGDLLLSEQEMEQTAEEFQQQAQEQQMAMNESNRAAGEAFRNEYAAQDGVLSTDSGLLYRVIEAGDGDKPAADSTVTVHYRGSLIDGSEFDSSYNRGEPTSFGLGSIIPGWNEILQLMSAGSKWEVVIPPQLAYGDGGAPPAIPPQATLVFEIELISFE